jgi:hypothetical protein
MTDAFDASPASGGERSRLQQNTGLTDEIATSICDIIEGVPVPNGHARIELPAPPTRETEKIDNGPRSWGFSVEDLNRDYALVILGGKAVVVHEQSAGPIEERARVLSIEAFNAWFANRPTETVSSDGKVKVVPWSRAWLTHRNRRQYAGVEFFPNPDGAEGTPGYLNFWRGFGIEPKSTGTYHVFKDHLLNNICEGDRTLFNYVFAWCAHIVQRPRERIGIAMVLCGKMGTGKSKFGEVIGSLFPGHYYQVDDARYVTGQFNVHMAKCLLLQADEAVWAGDKAAEGRLKGLITSDTQMIESKGIDPFKLRNYVRIIMTSNEEWVVPAGKDERRYCVLDVNPRCAQKSDYFREMDEELNNGGRERLLHDLLAFDLDQIDLRHVPKTRALLEQKLRSLDPIESWLYDRLWSGAPMYDTSEWSRIVGTGDLYNDYLRSAAQIGVGRKRSSAEFGKKIAKLIPDIRRIRPRETDEHGVTRRDWKYELPSLADCRAAFAAALNQPIDWLVLPGEGEREAVTDGDAVPL